ncbi:ribosomal-processing cysteine protease Prp [Dethiobacter alkaliphilus]|uniref:ribosomal-processing cysteine protease Prp n=1 Tax=Dethiobacter alkaliphilus TaxID=427926 RepID=UPI002226C2A7|nr:ribosomal-processing cysteine protease Prp [Dethiobacter alkaliphilus]MCW3489234.1 ribosomal-processing cysteine protease Prp [Dethiobacter alkaliphilus]
MIHVRVKRAGGMISRVTVSGHAGSAPKGEDLICSAVSALVQTFYFSLQRLLQLDVNADVRDGYLSVSIPAEIQAETEAKVALLANSMLVGLEEIDRSYPGFLQVSEE